MPILLCKEEKHTCGKKQKGNRTPVVPGKSMTKGINANDPGQADHSGFKPEIMNNIYPEDRQAGEEQGQDGTMHRTGDGGPDSNEVRADL